MLFAVFDVAPGAVARAEFGGLLAVGLLDRVASLLYGAFDSASLHLLVGRNFGIEMMAFEHERERHAHDKEGNGACGAQNDGQPEWHNRLNLKSFHSSI